MLKVSYVFSLQEKSITLRLYWYDVRPLPEEGMVAGCESAMETPLRDAFTMQIYGFSLNRKRKVIKKCGKRRDNVLGWLAGEAVIQKRGVSVLTHPFVLWR